MNRAGYCSKIFDTGTNTNTVTSLPVPKQCFFTIPNFVQRKINYITHYGTNVFMCFSATTM